MDIYVQSRGVSKEYCWLDKNQTKISDLPDNLKQMLEMVDGDYFSLVIYRAKNQLSLLVTALKSQDRIDNRTRKICNSLLWVGKDSDEDTLRSLSIQALNGDLAAKIDQAVFSENNTQGFEVKFEQLKPENLGLPSVENKSPADSYSSKKIGNLSALKDSLIDDLKKYSLPKHDGILVVVCSTVSKSSLEREQVWRGLSDGISDNDDDEWIDIDINIVSDDSKKSSEEDKGGDFRRPFSKKDAGKNNGNNGNNKDDKDVQPKQGLTMGQKVLSVFLAISIIINIGLFLKWQEAIENKKEYENLQEKSEAMRTEISNNENQIKDQKQKIDEQKLTLKTEGETLNKIVKFNEKFNTEGRQLLDEINNIKGIQK